MFLDELEQNAEGLAPATEAILILEEAFKTTEAQKIMR